MPAVVTDLAKQYKIMGIPIDSTHTDMLYEKFKYIPVEILQLNPVEGKRNLRTSMLSAPSSFSSQEIKCGG